MPESSFKCPTCRKAVERSAPEFPFCSERCRLIDLGNWASGKYAIPEREPGAEPSSPTTPADKQDDRD